MGFYISVNDQNNFNQITNLVGDKSFKINCTEADLKLIEDVVIDRFLYVLFNNCKFVLSTGIKIEKIRKLRKELWSIFDRTQLALDNVREMIKSIRTNPNSYFSDKYNCYYYSIVIRKALHIHNKLNIKNSFISKAVTNLRYGDYFEVLDDEYLESFLSAFNYDFFEFLMEVCFFCRFRENMK